jgi:NhaP-type Na+/H+ and K+/H+ antiporter
VFVGGDFQDGFAWLSGIAIFLLLTSLRNSWDLLVSVGAAIQTPART